MLLEKQTILFLLNSALMGPNSVSQIGELLLGHTELLAGDHLVLNDLNFGKCL